MPEVVSLELTQAGPMGCWTSGRRPRSFQDTGGGRQQNSAWSWIYQRMARCPVTRSTNNGQSAAKSGEAGW